ncbi:MAG: hypothetical protein EA387_11245 [Nitriliruptor sp.]|nr:MAG: hypothetical protein EA387_11245 [Nitriliruptor sp.]
MSWDVYVQDIPRDASTPGDIPDDFQPVGLGLAHEDVIAAARQVGGTVDASDPAWATWQGAGYDIELNLGDEPVDSFAIHCRGDADACRGAAQGLIEALGVRAFVVEDGDIIG